MKKTICLLLFTLLFAGNSIYAKSKKRSKKKKVDPSALVINGDFSGGLDDWDYRIQDEYKGTMKEPKVSKDGFSVSVPYPTTGYYVALNQELPELSESDTYQLVFDIKSSAEGKIIVFVHTKDTSKRARFSTAGLQQQIKTESVQEWTRYTVNFQPQNLNSVHPQKVGFFFGQSKGNTQIRNVSMKKVDDISVSNTKAGDKTVENVE